MSYTKHFVWNALPEERAALAAASRSTVGAAWTLEQLFTGCTCWCSARRPLLVADRFLHGRGPW
eukprot:2980888-Prymnesium_polylepis.1